MADGLAAANATLAATRDLQGQLASIRQRALDLGLEQLQPGLLEVCGLGGMPCGCRSGGLVCGGGGGRVSGWIVGLFFGLVQGGREGDGGQLWRRCPLPTTLPPACHPSTLSLHPPLLQTVAEFGQRVDEVADGLGTATNDIQTAVLNRLQRLQSDWQPLADRLDVV